MQAPFVTLCVILMSLICEEAQAQVALDPSESVTVCNGSMLEQLCTTTGGLLEWNFFTRAANGQRVSRRLSTRSGASQLQTNATNITFSRISASSSLPLVSKLLITPTYTDLNGTEINCADLVTSTSSSVIVYVTNEDSIHDQGINVSSLSEQFESNNVTVALNLTTRGYSLASYDVITTPGAALTLKEAIRFQLQVFYNTVYNVTVIGTSLVCRKNVTASIGLHYVNCGDPSSLQNHSVIITGYTDPALPRRSVQFSCAPTLAMSGPNSSTCMENGQWVPDPGEVQCNLHANCRDPSSPQVNYSVIVTSYIDPALPGRSVQFSCPPTLAMSGPNSSTCMGNGEWVPDPWEVKCTCNLHGPSHGPIVTQISGVEKQAIASGGVITALVASVLTFLITFVFTFIIGFMCGICSVKKKPRPAGANKSHDQPQQHPIPVYEDVLTNFKDVKRQEQILELKQNVAYGPIGLSSSVAVST